MISTPQFYIQVLDNMYEGVYFVDNNRRITYWNKSAEAISGYSSDDVLGQHCWNNILKHIDQCGHAHCRDSCPLACTLADGQTREVELYLHHKHGHRVPISLRVSPLRDEHGNICGAIEIFIDNSAKVAILERVEELEKMAMVDTLTKLPNRRYLETKLPHILSEYHENGFAVGVLFIDVDHFKNINDMYGHDVGDEVLKMVANTLAINSRASDIFCRWGGEEFVGIVHNVTEAQLEEIANRFRILVGTSSLDMGREEIKVTLSIGATISRGNDNSNSLLKRADQLMYHSKQTGRDRVTIKPQQNSFTKAKRPPKLKLQTMLG
ncbi:MAG TPA: sensor domain-containing diguanylate cyclase [Oscillatoriaceae cyanobacterium M33_DOE_052]|uniref:Diguanylate cyclase n=1 Tax=Planktothricoides sp. SpSt-374 TaxID=2282167 RepID=A0A7C3ZP35_9CYAN|nr:sensor domain-containing diguanylate cyclase [Oscillatoriaceae cyanobacterium M33_DOE_052]